MTTTQASVPTADHLPECLAALRHRVDGDVLVPGDAGFAEAASDWNRSAVHDPAVIVVAEDVGDVIATVAFARDCGLGLGVQATGHGVTRPVDGVLLVTARMDDVEIDPEGHVAWLGAGCRWEGVLGATREHGLAPLAGAATTVGAVGYCLGGGLGWLARRFGPACDAVRSLEVVTPSGELVRACRDENPELFRALRGGGGGALGVVTEIEVELFPVTTVYAGNLYYPAESAPEVVARWSAWVAGAPAELTSSVVLTSIEQAGPASESGPDTGWHGPATIVRGCWSGDVAAGRALLDSWRALCPPLLDEWREMPFAEIGSISVETLDPRPAVSTCGWLVDDDETGLAEEIGATLAAVTFVDEDWPALHLSEIRHLGGAVATGPGRERSSMGNRDDRFLVHMVGITGPAHDAASIRRHLEAVKAALGRHLTGRTYLNMLDGDERWAGASTSIDEPDLAAIIAVRAALDPDGLLPYGVDHLR